jgi:hypothetical protein
MSLKERLKQKIRRVLGTAALEEHLARLLMPEPSRDLAQALQFRATQASAELIEQHMATAIALSSPFEVLDHALKEIAGRAGLYLEFGVYQGSTLKYISERTNATIYGFDSFEGLPETWRDGYRVNHFSLKQSELPTFASNVELVVGWFDDTLPRFLEAHAEEKVAFLHIDCDLYSSTKTVLTGLRDRLVAGSVIVFNDYFNYPGWQQHEYRAFDEWIQETGRRFEYVSYNQLHEQVGVRLL